VRCTYRADMSKPGELIRHEEIDTAIAGAQAWKMRYHSVDVNGKPHEVTGLVIAPVGPGENRPVMTWGHGTTGMGDASCPSAQPDPAREIITYFEAKSTQQIDYGVPGLQGFIDEGWVVCATDYQGLGTPGRHQYTVNRTQARDTINIVHAARSMPVGAGTSVGCMGWSQGGGTAAAVAELDPADYGDLTLIGTVPMSPGVPKDGLTLASAGFTAGLSDPSTPPDGHLVLILAGYQAAFPDQLALSDVFTPLGMELVETSWNHMPIHHLSDVIDRMFRLKGPILNHPPKNWEVWSKAITAGSANLIKPVCPVLVCMDTFDGGTVVPVPLQQAYVTAAQALGGKVDTREYPHDDHFSLPAGCVHEARDWLTHHLP
jgi:pimeloyl-ACP methyl ester carboxylesterase